MKKIAIYKHKAGADSLADIIKNGTLMHIGTQSECTAILRKIRAKLGSQWSPETTGLRKTAFVKALMRRLFVVEFDGVKLIKL